MRGFASVVIWIVSVLLTILLFLVESILTVLLFPFDKYRKVNHCQCYWWSESIININPFWKVVLKGRENLQKDKIYIIVANHTSLADIVVLYKLRTQFKWVAKQSLFNIPFIGWCLRLTKHIRLSRGAYSSIKQVYKDASVWLKRGISVLFFPEGTRSGSTKLNAFQNGAFKLAIKERVPVLPVSIHWTENPIKKGDWRFAPKVVCTIEIHPSIDTSGMKPADFELLRDKAYNEIESRVFPSA